MQYDADASCDSKWRELKIHKDKKLIARKEVCLEKNVPIKEILKKESEHQTCQMCLTRMELMVQLSYITKILRKETIWLNHKTRE